MDDFIYLFSSLEMKNDVHQGTTLGLVIFNVFRNIILCYHADNHTIYIDDTKNNSSVKK